MAVALGTTSLVDSYDEDATSASIIETSEVEKKGKGFWTSLFHKLRAICTYHWIGWRQLRHHFPDFSRARACSVVNF